MTQKAISDEQIIAALLTHSTIRQAAAAAGISERTLYDRMNGGEFQALYRAAKTDLIRGAVFSVTGKLQAAQTILNTAGKFMQRLQDSENTVAQQVEHNRLNFFDL